MTWADATACSVIEALSDKAGTGGVAVAVAAADPSGPVTRTSPGGLPPAGRFEIGSVTKTMTAAVLACLTEDGVLSLDDQIGRWLNAGANGEITVRQLATHTSGLPSRPPNLPVSGANPWAGYTFDRAEEGCGGPSSPRDAHGGTRTSAISCSAWSWNGPPDGSIRR
jgi:CubicO group peptidase (beta-lactamase class C family)